jgi:hypothetical protein
MARRIVYRRFHSAFAAYDFVEDVAASGTEVYRHKVFRDGDTVQIFMIVDKPRERDEYGAFVDVVIGKGKK